MSMNKRRISIPGQPGPSPKQGRWSKVSLANRRLTQRLARTSTLHIYGKYLVLEKKHIQIYFQKKNIVNELTGLLAGEKSRRWAAGGVRVSDRFTVLKAFFWNSISASEYWVQGILGSYTTTAAWRNEERCVPVPLGRFRGTATPSCEKGIKMAFGKILYTMDMPALFRLCYEPSSLGLALYSITGIKVVLV